MSNLLGTFIQKLNVKKHQFREKNIATDHRISHVLTDQTSFTVREAYKTARTNIMFALTSGSDSCKKIVLTSAEPGEGKTTTVLNLAITFAQTGSKVLVIDGDLRKPRIHRYLHIDRKNGLSDLLIGHTDIKTAVRHSEKLNIDCIPAGQIPPNPVELLSNPSMEKLLEELSSMYDYIFIDSPPVTVVADATAMSKIIDGYVVVVRHNYTIHELLSQTRSALLFAEGKVLGYIMNDIKPLGGLSYNQYGAYSNKYYHSYKNKYGYGLRYQYRYTYNEALYQNNDSDNEEE